MGWFVGQIFVHICFTGVVCSVQGSKGQPCTQGLCRVTHDTTLLNIESVIFCEAYIYIVQKSYVVSNGYMQVRLGGQLNHLNVRRVTSDQYICSPRIFSYNFFNCTSTEYVHKYLLQISIQRYDVFCCLRYIHSYTKKGLL